MYSNQNDVRINNNSSGALTKWTLHVSTIQTKAWVSATGGVEALSGAGWAGDDVDMNFGGWLLGTEAGINTCVLSAVFKSVAATALDYDYITESATRDLLVMRTTANALDTWDVNNRFDPAADGYASRITGSTPVWTMPGDTRDVYFKFCSPVVVSDQNWRRIVVVVTAGQ